MNLVDDLLIVALSVELNNRVFTEPYLALFLQNDVTDNAIQK